jgi:zinc transport system permease protein
VSPARDDPRALIRYALAGAALTVVLAWTAYLARHVLLLIYVAGVVAIGLSPIVATVERRGARLIGNRVPRWLAILTIYLAVIGTLVGVFVLVLLAREYNHLLLDSLNRPLANVAGARSIYLEYFFAVLLTLSIVVSLKIIGALLVEALVVVPAAAARNVANSTRSYLIWSIAVAFFAGAGGLAVSTKFLVPTGGAVVLAVSAIFFVTLAVRAMHRRSAA